MRPTAVAENVTEMRALAALTVLLIASVTHAQELPARTYSASAMVGYSSEAMALWTDSPNKYQTGIGLRVGISIPKLYLGVSFVHHLGYRASASGVGSSYNEHSTNTVFGPEIGYDGHFGRYVILRPYLGAGAAYAWGRTEASGVVKEGGAFRFQITPGFLIGGRTGNVTFGLDLRAVFSPIDLPQHWAPGAFGTVGVAF